MALDIYFREDIANILHSVNMAGHGTATIVYKRIEIATGGNVDFDVSDLVDHFGTYRQGYHDALDAVAAAFGIVPGFRP